MQRSFEGHAGHALVYANPYLLSLLSRVCPPDQWKPINPEEKKRYDREFLLGFQFISASMHKPEGLPHISDVVLDKVSMPSAPGGSVCTEPL